MKIIFILQKVFVALSCVLVAVSARPQDTHHHHYYINGVPQTQGTYGSASQKLVKQSQSPSSGFDLTNVNWLNPSTWNLDQLTQFWTQNNRQGGAPSYAPSYTPSYAPQRKAEVVAAPVAPAADFDLSNIDFDFSGIMSDPWGSLDQATASLDDLNKDFPDVLAKMDPSMKAQVKKVNQQVIDVCNKMMADQSKSDSVFDFSAGMKTTCDYIAKTANEISLGMDDPAVVNQLIEKLKEFTAGFSMFRSSGAQKAY